jgi:hypothetical protein
MLAEQHLTQFRFLTGTTAFVAPPVAPTSPGAGTGGANGTPAGGINPFGCG